LKVGENGILKGGVPGGVGEFTPAQGGFLVPEDTRHMFRPRKGDIVLAAPGIEREQWPVQIRLEWPGDRFFFFV